MDTYEYQYNAMDVSGGDAAAAGALFAGLMLMYLVAAVIGYVITGIFLGKIFQKAGEPAWPAWVPVYNVWKMMELGGQPGWWALLMLVPFVNIVAIVFMIIAMYQIGLNFGKPGVFVLLAIFLGPVWMIWLAVDKSAVWNGQGGNVQAVPAGPAVASAPANETTVNDDSFQPPQSPPNSTPSV